ncbi:thiamine phosphate synthase [Thermomonas carbonis]|uniref:Thiamine-phosphate synthase n=1 Tax=Thermomonas carbonis TaxID=1463158 RepID=A0A7G9SRM6_9GAMM|nr:thiamine phosphate synthase [Thermomonas carbonis]QNN70501.1 thiamine phosphate synthase [Thermomonas carbonis]GHC00429.1 thiamine-phosphate synthase [Thermomonas carbonis]
MLGTGLYLITPDDPDPARLLARTTPLLPFASCLQLRNKVMDAAQLRDAGRSLRDACSDASVPFIVNDDAALAAELGADGVHLGEEDGGIALARALLGDAAIIGASCYDDIERARRLAAEGADYLAFGAFFPSPTKPQARRASLQLLRDSAGLGLPRVAIGGITPDNGGSLVTAGADLIAVISGVFDAPDPIAAAQAYLSLFRNTLSGTNKIA